MPDRKGPDLAGPEQTDPDRAPQAPQPLRGVEDSVAPVPGARGRWQGNGRLAVLAVLAVLGMGVLWIEGRRPPMSSPGAAGSAPSGLPGRGEGGGGSMGSGASLPRPAELTAPPVPEHRERPVPSQVPLRFDTLYRADDGGVVLSGRAGPGVQVEVLLDGAVVASALADRRGSFAALFALPASTQMRQLRLRVMTEDGGYREGSEVLSVAPFDTLAPAPAVTAQPGAAGDGASPATASPAVPDPSAAAADNTAPQAMAVVLTDGQGGARLLAAPSRDLVIDTLAYGAQGQVVLSGRGAPAGAVLVVLLDGQERLRAPVAPGNWQLELPGIAPGRYRLELEARASTGALLAQTETPFERAAPAALDAALRAAAQAPQSDAASAPAGPGGVITVQPGHSLWAIAEQTYGNGYLYVQVLRANRARIHDPDLIYPGQVFDLPR